MKNGFTLTELLASMVILAILVVLAIPAYTAVYTGVKRSNLNGKVAEIETAAKKYGDLIKDEIKNASDSCIETNVAELIEKGYLTSESDENSVIYNPTDNTELNGKVKICYCLSDFDIEAYYVTEFVKKQVYHKGDIVEVNNKLYECVNDYKNGSGIYGTNDKGKRFFEEIIC